MNDDETTTDALLREFLLGKLNDEEPERIEGLFVTDPQARERVLAVEQDLIEDYLEGTLSTEDSERFVARYAQTVEQRRRLRITKSIKDWALTEARAAQVVPAEVSRWSRLRSWLTPAFVVPIAAMVLIVIVVGALWLSRRAEHSTIERELAQLNAASTGSDISAPHELSPVTVRSATPQVQLDPAPENGTVELRLRWIQPERYSSYQATIHRVGDSESYTVPNLSVSSDGKSIRLRLSPHFRRRGIYQITVSGITSNGTPGPTDEYQLTVGS